MALCEAATSLLVLARRPPPDALGAAPRSPLPWPAWLTPWALREHAQLLPETVAAPLLLGAALAAGRGGAAARWPGRAGPRSR